VNADGAWGIGSRQPHSVTAVVGEKTYLGVVRHGE
jgi:hypothetical protein